MASGELPEPVREALSKNPGCGLLQQHQTSRVFRNGESQSAWERSYFMMCPGRPAEHIFTERSDTAGGGSSGHAGAWSGSPWGERPSWGGSIVGGLFDALLGGRTAPTPPQPRVSRESGATAERLPAASPPGVALRGTSRSVTEM